ncbi:DNA-binding response regulator [Bacillus sp. T33-2]|nr:helix-turn-helix domain-containing protein [Bacillus sp. T33-2]PLR97559.1 DNA-binding response regulator [Bacillus sp. T33-2]
MAGLLIVDDDIETRQAVRSIIQGSPFSDLPIWEEETAEKGMERLKDKQPSFLLLDLSLPDMDGIALGKKALDIDPEIHVIAVTHLQMFQTVQVCINAGFSAYLLKPLSKGELLQIFARLHTAELLQASITHLNNKDQHIGEVLEKDLGNPIQTAIKYIQLNYHKPLHLKEVADMVYLSPSHFSRLFKEEAGLTFIEYLTDYRLDKSKHLLRMTSMPIEVIASMTGFASSAYFSTSFKRKEGQTPSEYRQMCSFSTTG